MMHEKQFINWQAVPEPGAKPRKVPTDARTGLPIDPHDRGRWMSHADALATGLPVGFVLTANDPYFVIDIDSVREPETGVWDQRALHLLAMFPGAFAEVSVSGNGLHIYGRADAAALGPRRRKFETSTGLKIECYTDRRFMALGQANNGGNADIDWTSTLEALLPVSSDPADMVPLSDTVDPAWCGPEDDDELIALMLKARGSIAAAFGDAATVADLWEARADILGRVYPSTTGDAFDRSSADQALCNALAFWAGKNTARMDRLFRRSGLMREKWERPDYSTATISNAVRSTRNVYNRTPRLGLPPGVTAPYVRSFDDIMTDARNLAPDDVEAIKALCTEAGTLGPVEKATILRQIRTNTDVPMADLKKQADGNEGEPDHLEFARKAIAEIGPENIIVAGQFYWKFANGLWKQCDDREIKKHVQKTLSAEGYVVTAPRISGVTDVLKTEIFQPNHEFNRGNPESINVVNGELELFNGQWHLHPHRRELYRSVQLPVTFDPNARAPLFERFLLDIFRDDSDRDDKIRAVLELIGYSLVSHANREKFVLLIGAGANGKSVLLSILEALVGKENTASVTPGNFDNRFQRGHLRDKLANIVSELRQGETIADAELKAMVSGESMTAEHKNAHPFEFKPFCTNWFASNHTPLTRDFSPAFFRRAVVIKFDRIFSANEQDPNLKQKLQAELPGVLNHALSAYASVVERNGFTTPASSTEAQRKWQVEADQVQQFVDDRCQAVSGAKVSVSLLYTAYQAWSQSMGIRNVLGQLQFGNRLEQLGHPRTRTSTGRFINGLTVTGFPT